MFGSTYNTRREKLNRVIIIQREKSNFPRKGFLWVSKQFVPKEKLSL